MDIIGYSGKVILTRNVNGKNKSYVMHNSGTINLFEIVARHLTYEDSASDKINDIQLYTQESGEPKTVCLYNALKIGKMYFETTDEQVTIYIDTTLSYSNIIQSIVKSQEETDNLLFVLRSKDSKILAKTNVAVSEIRAIGIGRQAQLSWQLTFKNVTE